MWGWGWSILKGRWRGERRQRGRKEGGQWPIENKWLVSNRWGASVYTQGYKGSRAGDAHLSCALHTPICPHTHTLITTPVGKVWCNLWLLLCACCWPEKVLTNRCRARHTLSKQSNIHQIFFYTVKRKEMYHPQLRTGTGWSRRCFPSRPSEQDNPEMWTELFFYMLLLLQ